VIDIVATKESGLGLKGHSIAALVVLLIGLPVLTAYVMDVSSWFEGDTTVRHGTWSRVNETGSPWHSDDATWDYNNMTSSGLTCPEDRSFWWIESGESHASYIVPARGNASTGWLYCGWSGTLDFNGASSGTYGGGWDGPANTTELGRDMERDDMIFINMPPCNIDSDRPAHGSSLAALGHVSCGYSEYKLGVPSAAFPTDTAMVGFHFAVLGGLIYGETSCAHNFKLRYQWELAVDGDVFAEGENQHWNLLHCQMQNAYMGQTGYPYIQIDEAFDVVQVANYAELMPTIDDNSEFTIRVYELYDVTHDELLECDVYDLNCDYAHHPRMTAFDGSLDVADDMVHFPQCTTILLANTSGLYPFDCAMNVGLVVHTADFEGAGGFTLGLFTWGLGGLFMIIAVASTALWDPFKAKAKGVVLNAGG